VAWYEETFKQEGYIQPLFYIDKEGIKSRPLNSNGIAKNFS